MGETRKLAAILVADVVGYSRLAAADEDRTLARLRGSVAISLIPPSPRITAVSSSAPATEPHRVPQRRRRRALRHRGAERRRPDLSRPTRTQSRRHAQGRVPEQ